MCADGFLIKDDTKIGMELSVEDKDHLKEFSAQVGYPIERIYPTTHYVIDNNEIKAFEARRIVFGCKPMINRK